MGPRYLLSTRLPVLLLLVGCGSAVAPRDGGSAIDSGPVEMGTPDSGAPDAGLPVADAGSADAGVDAGIDAGSADAGSDAGSADAGSDAGFVDAGPVDAGIDAGSVDTGDAGAVDAGAEDAGNPCGCDPNATCQQVGRASLCTCNTGYVGDGVSCEWAASVLTGLGNTSPDAGMEETRNTLYELGTAFVPTSAVRAVGVRYYRSSGMTAPRTGHLWDGSGNLLGTVSLPGTDTGWQDAWFITPVTLTVGAHYTVSVDSTDYYLYDGVGLLSNTTVTDGPITYPSYNSGTYNGVWGPSGQWPTQGLGDFYYVDVDYVLPCQASTDCSAAFTGTEPGDWTCMDNVCVPMPLDNCLTNNGGCDPNATCVYGGPSTSSCACNPGYVGTGVTCVPAESVQPGLSVSPDAGTEQTQPPLYEYGTEFWANSGFAVGVRYYRSPSMTAPRTGHLWDYQGNLLGTVSLPGTDTGWQHAYFDTPINLQYGWYYTVSIDSTDHIMYHDPGLLSTAEMGDGDIHYPPDSSGTPHGNGVYGPAGQWPTQDGAGDFFYVDVDYVVWCQASTDCSAGFPGTGPGSWTCTDAVCVPVNNCTTNNGGCDPNATCTDTGPGTNSCTCNAGFVGGNGTTCEPSASVQTGLGNTAPDAGVENTHVATDEYGTALIPQAGVIAVGIRYYRSPSMTAARTGHLWDSAGNLLGTLSLPGTATGWQDAYFDTPIALSSGSQYVVSVDSTDGVVYADTTLLATASTTEGVLVYPGGTSAANGVYGPSGMFPTQNANGAFYYVDLDYMSQCQRSADCGAPAGGWTCTDAACIPVNNCGTNNGGCEANATCIYTGPATNSCACNSGFVGHNGNACEPAASVQTGVGNTSPDAGTQLTQGNSYEYGTVFVPHLAVRAVGVRYYRSSGMTTSRTGHLWDSGGNLLGTVSLPGTGTGWQDAYFDTPVTLTANANYTVSIRSTDNIAYGDSGLFNSTVTDGPITYPANTSTSSNGAWGPAGSLPILGSGGTFYYVDVDYVVPCQANTDCSALSSGAGTCTDAVCVP